MAISLYDISVSSFLQILDAASGFLDKGAQHCKEGGISLDEIVETRLFSDMRPFRFQVQQMVNHSLGCIDALGSGRFSPSDRGTPTDDYAALQKLIADTRAALRKITPADVNARDGADVTFAVGDLKMPFRAMEFVLSFSHPNFYFHAATAYDILRMKGVPVGKRDYMGMPRIKG